MVLRWPLISLIGYLVIMVTENMKENLFTERGCSMHELLMLQVVGEVTIIRVKELVE